MRRVKNPSVRLSTRWRSKLKGKSGRSGRSLDLSIDGAKTATPALDFFSALLSALYISLPVVLKTRRKLAGKVSIHSRPAKVTLSAIYKTFIRAEITNQYPLPGSTSLGGRIWTLTRQFLKVAKHLCRAWSRATADSFSFTTETSLRALLTVLTACSTVALFSQFPPKIALWSH